MRSVLFIAALLIGCAPLRAEFPLEMISPELRFTPGENDAEWRPLLDALAKKGAIFSTFEERRYFPFKKIAVVLTGEIRLAPDRGLSLRYLTPEDRLMVVDAKGVLLRDAKDRTRELPADARAQAATGALLDIMRFDFERLAKEFEIYAVRDGEAWRFAFEPRATLAGSGLTRLIVTGKNEAVTTIEMRKSAMQRIEIHLGETRTGVEFSAAEQTRFFR